MSTTQAPRSNSFRTFIRRKAEELADDQDTLREKRKWVTNERLALRVRRKEVHDQIVSTANAEAAFMDRIRELYNVYGSTFAAALEAAYRKVEEERTKLGALESGYLKKEEDFGGQEWSLTKQETTFYQYRIEETFLDDDTPPQDIILPHAEEPHVSVPSPKTSTAALIFEYQMTASQWRRLLKELKRLQPCQIKILYIYGKGYQDALFQMSPVDHYENLRTLGDTKNDNTFREEYERLFDQTMACERKVKELKADLLRYNVPASLILFPSHAVQPLLELPLPIETKPEGLLDGTPPDAFQGLPSKDRILEWLLSYLLGSALERLYFRVILQTNLQRAKVNFEIPEDAASQYWLMDTYDNKEDDTQSQYGDNGLWADSKAADSKPVPGRISMTATDKVISAYLWAARKVGATSDVPRAPKERFMESWDIIERPEDFDRDYSLKSIGEWNDAEDTATPIIIQEFENDVVSTTGEGITSVEPLRNGTPRSNNAQHALPTQDLTLIQDVDNVPRPKFGRDGEHLWDSGSPQADSRIASTIDWESSVHEFVNGDARRYIASNSVTMEPHPDDFTKGSGRGPHPDIHSDIQDFEYTVNATISPSPQGTLRSEFGSFHALQQVVSESPTLTRPVENHPTSFNNNDRLSTGHHHGVTNGIHPPPIDPRPDLTRLRTDPSPFPTPSTTFDSKKATHPKAKSLKQQRTGRNIKWFSLVRWVRR